MFKQGLAIAAASLFLTGSFAISAYAAPNENDGGNGSHISESYAKQLITDDNYTNPTDMHKTSQGWTAKAKDLGQPVDLLVTNRGYIDQQGQHYQQK